MGALGALMLMGVARKVMLGKTGQFVRSFASLPAPATSQPTNRNMVGSPLSRTLAVSPPSRA